MIRWAIQALETPWFILSIKSWLFCFKFLYWIQSRKLLEQFEPKWFNNCIIPMSLVCPEIPAAVQSEWDLNMVYNVINNVLLVWYSLKSIFYHGGYNRLWLPCVHFIVFLSWWFQQALITLCSFYRQYCKITHFHFTCDNKATNLFLSFSVTTPIPPLTTMNLMLIFNVRFDCQNSDTVNNFKGLLRNKVIAQ